MRQVLTKLIIFITIPFVLILTIELSCKIIGIPKIVHFRIEAKAQELMPKIDNKTILLLGDSRIEWGIKPSILQERYQDLGYKVYNLASPGSNGLDILKFLKKNGIHPRVIIIGYTSNYGIYKNFGLDNMRYTYINRMYENLKYFFRTNYYVADESINLYLSEEKPYWKKFEYDSLGGANVYEYGAYKSRLEFQESWYVSCRETFNSRELELYHQSLNELLTYFNANNSKVIGINMPICKSLINIETVSDSSFSPIKYYDFLNLTDFIYKAEPVLPDSCYFLDGSHLNKEYAVEFSKKIIELIHLDEILGEEKFVTKIDK